MHLARYDDVVVFDQATKLVYVISWVHAPGAHDGDNGGASNTSAAELRAAYDAGAARLEALVAKLSSGAPSLAPAQVWSTGLRAAAAAGLWW